MLAIAMGHFSEWLQRELDARSMGQRPLAQATGMAQSTINNWLGGVALPSDQTGRYIARYFEASEREVLERIERDRQGRLARRVGDQLQPPPIEIGEEVMRVPVADFALGAGPGGFNDVTWIARDEMQNAGEVVGYRVKGTSMEHIGIQDGSIIFVDKDQRARPGDDVVAWTSEGGVVKRLEERSGKLYLTGNGSPWIPVDEGVVFGGVVVGVLQRNWKRPKED